MVKSSDYQSVSNEDNKATSGNSNSVLNALKRFRNRHSENDDRDAFDERILGDSVRLNAKISEISDQIEDQLDADITPAPEPEVPSAEAAPDAEADAEKAPADTPKPEQRKRSHSFHSPAYSPNAPFPPVEPDFSASAEPPQLAPPSFPDGVMGTPSYGAAGSIDDEDYLQDEGEKKPDPDQLRSRVNSRVAVAGVFPKSRPATKHGNVPISKPQEARLQRPRARAAELPRKEKAALKSADPGAAQPTSKETQGSDTKHQELLKISPETQAAEPQQQVAALKGLYHRRQSTALLNNHLVRRSTEPELKEDELLRTGTEPARNFLYHAPSEAATPAASPTVPEEPAVDDIMDSTDFPTHEPANDPDVIPDHISRTPASEFNSFEEQPSTDPDNVFQALNIDEDELVMRIYDLVHSELQHAWGQQITVNIRQLIRDEIAGALRQELKD